MRRLPFDNAVVRSSKLGFDAAVVRNGLDQGHSNIETLERHGQTGADHAAAHNGDVERVVHAACTKRSMASGVFSSAAVSTSGASRVTSTSSSMRMPMFQNSLGTRGEGRI